MYVETLLITSTLTVILFLNSKSKQKSKEFIHFQLKYFQVFAIVLLSDWLQGSYQYSLYKSYGYSLSEIAYFFIIGFTSSAIIGTFIGSICDFIGRKNGCLLYCFLYFCSCITKLSPSKELIIVGRLLGGISTSLLFSVFESYMISQHKLKFEIGLLDDTFQWSTFVNGFVAILSGLIANVSVDYHGLIAPFMIAAGCCLLAFSLITLTWAGDTTERSVETTGVEPDQSVETTGKRVTRSMSKGSPVKSPVTSTLKKPTTKQAKESKVSLILSQWTFQLTLLGLLQTMFESSMYIFVFLWSPVLEKTSKTVPPFGLIFSTFMVCIMLGSFIFKYFVTRGYELKFILTIVFITATVSFIIPIFTLNHDIIFLAFNVFELSCGIYFPTMGSLKSQKIPEETRSTIMNLFRIPLNLVVVLVLIKMDSMSDITRFGVCGGMCLMGLIGTLFITTTAKGKGKKKVE